MEEKHRLEGKQARRLATLLSVLLLFLALLAAWHGHARRAGLCAGGAAAVLVVRFAAFPLWLRFFALWMRLAEVLGWFWTGAILTLLYYVVITPVGLIFRIVGRDALDLKFRDGRSSYWIAKDPVESTLDRYRKPF